MKLNVFNWMAYVEIKRGLLDLYANMYYKLISESNLTCNSNVQLLILGRHVMYVTKYAIKGDAKEESDYFEKITNKM